MSRAHKKKKSIPETKPPLEKGVSETSAGSETDVTANVPTDNSRYGKVIAKLRARLATEPNALPLKVALAEALFRSTFDQSVSPVEALKQLNDAIRLDPFRPSFYYHRGLQWHRLGNLKNALSNYEQTLEFDPCNARVLHQIAVAQLDAGSPETALAKWDEAEKIVKQNAQKASERTQAEDNGSNGSGSTAAFDRALFIIQCGRAEAELRAGKAGEAIERLQTMKPPPDCAGLVGEVALKWLVMTADTAKVIEWLNSSLDQDYGADVRASLQPYLDAYGDPTEQFPLEFDKGASRSVRALRAMVAFDWGRHANEKEEGAGLFALRTLVEEQQDDDTLLDAYLALLHDHATRFYDNGRWHDACELWREALLVDQHNYAITHNLALAATRTRHEDDYQKWWEKTERLWYTRHLILPESKDYRSQIAEKHFAFAAKAADLATRWDGDANALTPVVLWVDEMERYFLCEQYSFTSAYHLLGVPLSADNRIILQAYDAMKSKTRRYSNTLPELKDTLKRIRLRRLEEAYKQVADAAARKSYHPAHSREEGERSQLLRKRKVSYIIAVTNHLSDRAADFTVDVAESYAGLTKVLLEHPYRALQRQFEDELATEVGLEMSAQIREKLATFYFKKVEELVESQLRPAEIHKVSKLAEYLRELNPRQWQSLWFRAQIEYLTGSRKIAIDLATEAHDLCPDSKTKAAIREFIDKARKGAEVQDHIDAVDECMNNNRWAEALAILQKAIKLNPSDVMLYVRAARCLIGLERWHDVLAYLLKADKMSPLSATIYLMRATSLLHLAIAEFSSRNRSKAIERLDELRQVLIEARACPDYLSHAETFSELEGQLREAEARWG